jgi:hypothetical protein
MWSKLNRNNAYTQVQAIYFTENGFQSVEKSLSSDNIAVIELDEKIVLSPSVYPACVNWEKNETLYPKDGDIGQVSTSLFPLLLFRPFYVPLLQLRSSVLGSSHVDYSRS